MSAERWTSYEIWTYILLAQHPEIDLVSTVRYSLKPLRKAGNLEGEHDPLERRYDPKYFLTNIIFPGYEKYEGSKKDEEIKRLYSQISDLDTRPFAIHSIVGVGFKSSEVISEFERRLIPKEEFTFLFVDFDVPVSEVNEQIIDEVIEKMGIRGYLLRSDYSYHFVSDELTALDRLPLRYGKLINAFAGKDSRWEWVREIGDALINAEEYGEVEKICYDILAKVDHYGTGDKCFIVDLRNVAHSLLGVPTLRISSKEGVDYPPILIKEYEGRREKGLEPISKIIEESDIFCWMKPPAPKSA